MNDTDKLRPEVQAAHVILDAEVAPAGKVSYEAYRAWCVIHAELLRLTRTSIEWMEEAQELRNRAGQAEAELAALKARAQWQPIETAPHDGNRVLLWNRDWAAPFAGQFYGEAAGGWRLDYRIAPFTHQPTHWMPLPPPPSVEE